MRWREWCRIMWASEEARAVWEPRIARITRDGQTAERSSVGKLRDASIQSHRGDVLPELSRQCADRDLHLLVLGEVAAGGMYQASTRAAEPGEDSKFKVSVCIRGAAPEFARAFREGDDEAIGRMLGYPDCCRRFFAETWGAGKSKDPTRLMTGTPDRGPVECNALLRWLGVRWVPHMPCSWECEKTEELGKKFRRFASSEVKAWMDELLDMPIEWSALHGCGEIKTPLFTISASTDTVPGRQVIRRKGSAYPEAGVRGLRFPYLRQPPSRGKPEPARAAVWEMNGFTSEEAMLTAHEVVLDVIGGRQVRSVGDLGCGDGRLLEQVCADERFGVEANPKRAEAARRRGIEVECGDLFSANGKVPEMVLFFPGRLLEQKDPGARDRLLARLREAETLILYAYSDSLETHGLEELSRLAGFRGALTRHVARDQAEAGVWVWE